MNALHADDADGLPAGQHRHAQEGIGLNADHFHAQLGRLGAHILVQQQRFAALDDLRGQALAKGYPFKFFAIIVWEAYQLFALVQHGHVGDIGFEGLADLLADQFKQSRQLYFGRQAWLTG